MQPTALILTIKIKRSFHKSRVCVPNLGEGGWFTTYRIMVIKNKGDLTVNNVLIAVVN